MTSESSKDVDSNPFCLDFTINIDIKCPILNVEKLLIYRELGLAACDHWPLNIANEFADSVCFASVVDGKKKMKKKRCLREAGLKLLQLTVGYKLY